MTAGPDQLHRNPLSSSRIPALQSLSTIGNPSSKARAANTKVAFDTRPGDIVSQSSTARQIPIPALPKQSTSLAQSYGASGNFTYDQLEPSSHAEYVSSFYKPLTPRGAQLCDSYNNFDLAYPANEYYPIRGSQHVYDRSNMGYQWSGYTSTPTCYTNESTGYLSGQTGYYGVMNPTIAKPLDAQHIIRSPLLEEFRMAGKGKKFELRDIYDHIVEFSGDQLGSRFIQHKLEVAHSEEKERVFKELASNSRQLMTDVFGNYVIQKMFEHGTQAQKKMLASHMKGHMIALSTQTYGCRVVQTAIEHILTDQQASLIRELDGSVLAVIADQNGNHVIQRAIELLPEVHIQFIVDAHIGRVREQSKHPYGCRVMQRMLEFCSPKNTRRLLSELEKHLPELVLDAFGNYVVQHVIERGEPEDRRICIDAVNDRLLECATSKFASNVVEKALDRANDAQRQAMLRKLTGRNAAGQSQVASLLSHQFGNYVIQKCVYYLSGHALHSLLEEMDEYLNQLRQVSSGKQVSALEKSVQHADARLRKQGYLNPLQRAPTQPRTNLIHK